MTFLTIVLQVIRKEEVTSKVVATSKQGTSSLATNNQATSVVAINAPSLSRELASRFSV